MNMQKRLLQLLWLMVITTTFTTTSPTEAKAVCSKKKQKIILGKIDWSKIKTSISIQKYFSKI